MANHAAFHSIFPWELHISRKAREKYRLSDTLFCNDGKLVFGDSRAIRFLAHKMNETRAAESHVYPGELSAAGILDEACHFIFRAYENEREEPVFTQASEWVRHRMGPASFDKALLNFTSAFPPMAVYREKSNAGKYLQGESEGRSHVSIALEEALMLSLSATNPANHKLEELFHPGTLPDKKLFEKLVAELETFFTMQPGFGPDRLDVVTFLKIPFLIWPDNIMAQMEYILEHWKPWLPESMVRQILKGQDLIREDIRLDTRAGGPPGPTLVPRYKDTGTGQEATLGRSGYRFEDEAIRAYEEYEHFTQDTHWMPNVVLMAKNTYVWLDQLSKKYGRRIEKLDQVPDQELDILAAQGFNGLWLIGIWERSNASRKIKHLTGNPDAVSSAYSLYDYEIAGDLGGESAYHNLNHRARERGIRLASDMVPNHTGLFSKWTFENPDYFIQSRVSPFPAYRFTGENLSDHPDIEIRIEDGYYSKTDAAVVFQRYDKRYDDLRYIYHGNDGTNMPWNDTAQLDMLKHEVRQAVIEKIMDVARRFSIIRFDAAMTLAKKHFSRLWYPPPGSGGDIPSRSDYAMSRKEFDELFPVEFWREVVDRMNSEMPDTLLLAEAFWLMEGYFVRTLGMHRVYNSAFMHMMKNEENAKYRDLISNTLEFEPEILKRYVNFMSNPDEETAIRQFGTDDKYFGVCIMMVTLPGLPMFAHGQVEGYTEKYGMEYQRAYYNETPNQNLTDRHSKEVFPLLKKRQLFSEVENFHLFDFLDHSGQVNENVYAYTNRSGNEAALVLFNNRYERADGRIRESCPKLMKQGDGRKASGTSLAEALGMRNDEHAYYFFREQVGGLEYVRKGSEVFREGFPWGLNGFEYRVFIGFTTPEAGSKHLKSLHAKLQGRGSRDLRREVDELKFEATFKAFTDIFENLPATGDAKPRLMDDFRRFAIQAGRDLSVDFNVDKAAEAFLADIRSVAEALNAVQPEGQSPEENALDKIMVISPTTANSEGNMILPACFAIMALESSGPETEPSGSLFNVLSLHWPLQEILKKTGKGEQMAHRDILLIRILCKYGDALYHYGRRAGMPGTAGDMQAGEPDPGIAPKAKLAGEMLADPLVREFLGVNEYQNLWYYSKEHFEELNKWLFTLTYCRYFQGDTGGLAGDRMDQATERSKNLFHLINKLSGQAGYMLEKLMASLGDAH
jgi:glycosidase